MTGALEYLTVVGATAGGLSLAWQIATALRRRAAAARYRRLQPLFYEFGDMPDDRPENDPQMRLDEAVYNVASWPLTEDQRLALLQEELPFSSEILCQALRAEVACRTGDVPAHPAAPAPHAGASHD